MPLLPQAANTEENQEGMGDRSALPAGKYLAHMVKSAYLPNKKKTGHYLSAHFKVIAPEKYAGKMFFENLNLDNPNATTVEIANKAMNSLSSACGKTGVKDSDELLQIPIVATLTVKEATAQWPAGNNIVLYEAEAEWDDSAPGTTGSAPVMEDDFTEEAEDTKKPWE